MDVLLIHPSQLNAPTWGGAFPVRESTVSLWNHLRCRGHRVDYLDLDLDVGRASYRVARSVEAFRAGVKAQLERRTFDVAAISAFTSVHYLASMEVARLCREARPAARIVVGGYHPRAVPEDFTGADSPFDDVVVGDGEDVLAGICEGAFPRARGPRVHRSRFHDLAGASPVAWDELPYAELARGESVFINVSRGCPFGCAFCLDARTPWRSYDVATALDRVRRVYAALRPAVILLWEPVFGLKPAWRHAFLEGLVALDLDVLYCAMMRLDAIDERDVELLSRLRFKVDFGFESGCPRMLKRLNKSADPEGYLRRCRDVLAAMARWRVPNLLYVIYNAPGEDRVSNAESLEFVRGLRKISRVTEISPGAYTAFPGSEDDRRRKELELAYGTVFLRPRWWARTSGDLGAMASAVIPSAAAGIDLSWTSEYARWFELERDIHDEILPDVRARVFDPYWEHRVKFGCRLVKDLTSTAQGPAPGAQAAAAPPPVTCAGDRPAASASREGP